LKKEVRSVVLEQSCPR